VSPYGVPGAGSRLARFLGTLALAVVLGVGVAPPPASAQRGAADVFVAQAILAYEERRYQAALDALQEALAIDPDHVDALYYTGLVRAALDDLGAAARALERARTLSPTDDAVRLQLGLVYFALSRFDEAQVLLEPIFARNPAIENLGYYVGFMRYRQRDYAGALRSFRAGVTSDSSIEQLTRLYTAVALRFQGLREGALSEIEEALRRQPAAPLTGPLERLREAVRGARERERRLRAEVRLGVLYDDNVSLNPELSDDPIAIAARRRRADSVGELAGLRLDYAFFQRGAFEATASYSLFAAFYNDLPEINLMAHQAGLGASHRGAVRGLPYQLALQYGYEFITLAEQEFAQRHTVTPFATLIENDHNVTALQLRYQVKEFRDDMDLPAEERRDSTNVTGGFTHLFRFERDRHLLKVGYQFDVEDTDGPGRHGRNFSYVGHRLLLGGQATLPWAGIRLRYDFDAHFRDYLHRNTVNPARAPGTRARSDTELTHLVGLTVPLPWDLTLAADYQRIVNRSNLDVFRFERNVFSLALIWTY
jgi:tetratricopeptide (TPR) repeat protein